MLLSNVKAGSKFSDITGLCWSIDGDGTGGGRGRGERELPIFLSTTELAEMLRISARGLEKMRLENRGPRFVRLGKGGKAKVIYNLADVEAWIESLRKKG